MLQITTERLLIDRQLDEYLHFQVSRPHLRDCLRQIPCRSNSERTNIVSSKVTISASFAPEKKRERERDDSGNSDEERLVFAARSDVAETREESRQRRIVVIEWTSRRQTIGRPGSGFRWGRNRRTSYIAYSYIAMIG